jgi:hypothetical protein
MTLGQSEIGFRSARRSKGRQSRLRQTARHINGKEMPLKSPWSCVLRTRVRLPLGFAYGIMYHGHHRRRPG